MTFHRRDFGRLALAGAPALAGLSLPRFAAAATAASSKFGGVQIGMITYSLRQGVAKSDIIPSMVKLGISSVELMSGDCEAIAGAPAMPPFQFGGGRGPGGRGRGNGPVATAPNGCPVNTPSGQFSQAEANRAAGNAGEGRGPGGGRGRGPASPEMLEAQAKLKDWRAAANAATWAGVRKQFNDAGIDLRILCYNMGLQTTDDEMEYAFQMAKGLGVRAISCSTTVAVAKRVAPFADKHKLMWGGHGHADVHDPEQFAKPETFEQIMGFGKYIGVNLDIGHYTAAGYDPLPFIAKHHGRITNIHLKDRTKPDKCESSPNVVWGKGDTPIKDVLLTMKKKKYDFPANIEFEYPTPEGSDPVTEVGKCLDFCKRILTA
jgi:sugar phosphate isomerase/epimerase